MTRASRRMGAFMAALVTAMAAVMMFGFGLAQAEPYIQKVTCTPDQGSVTNTYEINLNKGAIETYFKFDNSSAYFEINTKSDFSGKIITNNTSSDDTRFAGVPTTGKYYLKLTCRANGTTNNVAAVGIENYNCYPENAPLALADKAYATASSCGDNNSVSYFKISAKSRGYFDLDFEGADGSSYPAFYVKLLNSKKKPMSGDWRYASGQNDVQGLAVKAKGTYYLAVKSYTSVYRIKSTFKASKAKIKASKSKAATVKAKKAVKAVIAYGDKAAWYKFKNTKAHVVKINLNARTFAGGNYGGVKFQIYQGKRLLRTTTLTSSYPTGQFKSIGKLPKGTYYIKVTRDKTGSGYFTLKWK